MEHRFTGTSDHGYKASAPPLLPFAGVPIEIWAYAWGGDLWGSKLRTSLQPWVIPRVRLVYAHEFRLQSTGNR